jgi:hypothetical protein
MKKLLLALLCFALLAGSAFGQRGSATPVVYGSGFPASAPYGTIYINYATPALYFCNNSPACTSSGQWVTTASAGSCSGVCANLTLSNLSGTTAIPVPLYSATNTNLLLAGAAGNSTYNPGTASLVGGTANASSSQVGGAAYVTGGAGGTSGTGAGGAVYVESGGAASGYSSGAVSIFTAPGVGAGAAGNLYLYAGNGGTTGAGGNIFGQAGHMGTIGSTNNGYISLAGGGASYATCSPLSGYECAFLFLAGATGAGPGEIDLTGGGSSQGIVRLSNMTLAYYADATYPLNLTTQRPTHAYFAGNVYATALSSGLTGAFSSLAAGTTLSTQNAANWHAEGQYGGSCVSQSGTMVLVFAANGILQSCYNGGAVQNVAYTTSTTTGTGGVAYPANCPSTGTTAWELAKLTTNSGAPCFVVTGTTDVSGIAGVVVAGAGTSGDPTVAQNGEAQLLLDGTPTANDFIVESTSTAGKGHDAGSSCPIGSQVLGRVVNTTADGNGAYTVLLGPEGCSGLSAPAIMLASGAALTSSPVAFSGTSPTAELWGFYLDHPITTSTAHYYVAAADSGSCTYDLGILNTAGNIVVHTGNQTAAALGMTAASEFHSYAWTAAATLQPGKYYLAITASATSGCATLGYTANATFAGDVVESVSSAGTLNNGMTIPSDGFVNSNTPVLIAN